MSSTADGPNDDAPTGWTVEETDDDVHSWLGPGERVLCVREADEWVAYSQPRSELGAPSRTPLTDGPTTRERALSTARAYMERHAEGA